MSMGNSASPLTRPAPRHAVALLGACFLAIAGLPAAAEPPAAPAPGAFTERVACLADGTQTYSLYLPSNYTPEHLWPVVFCFDPLARGRLPVERFQRAAELYGYVVIGSNNSRNGPSEVIAAAVSALLRDTMGRWHLDPYRVYAAGMSGGARIACALAARIRFAGVIACSAGFPDSTVPPKVEFALFGTAGVNDFNYREMKEAEAALTAQHAAHRLVIFDGGHEWLPEPLAREALAWLELQAMRSGRRPAHAAWVAAQYQQRLQAIAALSSPGETYLACVSVVADFDGLADTAEPARRAAALKDTKPVRQYFAAEKKSFREEQDWVESILAAAAEARQPPNARVGIAGLPIEISRIPTGGGLDSVDPGSAASSLAAVRPRDNLDFSGMDPEARFDALRDVVREVQRKSAENVAARRALGGAFMGLFEQGRTLLDAGKPAAAAEHFEALTVIRPEAAPPWFELARARALQGNRREAKELLATAIAKGFNDAKRITQLRESLAP